MRSTQRTTLYTLVAILALVTSTLPTVRHSVQAQSVPPKPDIQPAQSPDTQIYLPLIATPPAPLSSDALLISTPAAGQVIGGTTLFAVQPTGAAPFDRVTFRAGTADLGTDTTPDDGFKVFLDAGTLPRGPLELAATATDSRGDTATATVAVTIVDSLPSAATFGPEGTTIGTASGGTITVPPGAVNGTATIRAQDRTQQDVTAVTGFAWEQVGVTFLGAMEVESDTPMNRPLGISSVGFGNRVQPGQVTVTYQVLPDADGDGVDELVVTNGAELAPNGTIVSSPVPQATVNSVSTSSTGTQDANLAQAEPLRGVPGTPLTFEVSGFNPASARANTATFRSLVDSEEITIPLIPVTDIISNAATQQHLFRVVLPPLTPGATTVVLRNQSTGSTAGPFEITIDPLQPLSRPAATTIDETLASTSQALSTAAGLLGDAEEFATYVAQLNTTAEQATQLRTDFQEFSRNPTPDEQQALEVIASMLEASSVRTQMQARLQMVRLQQQGINPLCEIEDEIRNLITPITIVGGLLSGAAASEAAKAATQLLLKRIGIYGLAFVAGFLLVMTIQCWDYESPPPPEPVPDPPPLPLACAPTNPNGGGSPALLSAEHAPAQGRNPFFVGMGSAIPPGGNGCGDINDGGSGALVLQQAAGGIRPGRYIVRVFPQGGTGQPLSPFTAANDASGYFFMPLIPADEPFTAVAIDTLTGVARTFDGVGPAVGDSMYMFFDFSDAADETNVVDLDLGDTVSDGVPEEGAGNIELPGTTDVYSFAATADTRIALDVLAVDQSLLNTPFAVPIRLFDPNNTELFLTISLRSSTTGAVTLAQAGTYTIQVGSVDTSVTGTYSFQLREVPPPQEFPISLGDGISNGVPAAGAGNIEQPGNADRYIFTVPEPVDNERNIYFLARQVDATLLAPGNTVNLTLTRTDTGIAVPAGSVELSENLAIPPSLPGGTYALTIGGQDFRRGTGTYALEIGAIPPPQEFTISIGDTVSNDSPAAGAGAISIPGHIDYYVFTATAGQQIYLASLNVSPGLSNGVLWQLRGPDTFDEPLAGAVALGTDLGSITLPESGTYRISVRPFLSTATGTYSFELRSE